MLAMLLAIGLDHERSILFHQDQNLHHVELCWILNCLTRYLVSLTILSIVLVHPISTYRMLLGRTQAGDTDC
ncbi:hypothetical protein EDD16DRAFT_1665625 [Pisolithus croceorrhizus]|nr:hypothetical protein EDD16DRAFT_1665625 [Pisolithus croceorrhizus]